MGRPLSQGEGFILRDIHDLNRIVRRVMADPKRSPVERAKLIAHLKGAMSILLNSERAPDVLVSGKVSAG